ncbi:hypothetical protein [Paenibacillus sp. GM2]|uniref:hypothetical protein n=1 Tax=Paenibacillus sp. GM2 TaxID=1622070 RepID=UPI000839A857|nr:hypothetical protein [Paenibacillus sp. GM2]
MEQQLLFDLKSTFEDLMKQNLAVTTERIRKKLKASYEERQKKCSRGIFGYDIADRREDEGIPSSFAWEPL